MPGRVSTRSLLAIGSVCVAAFLFRFAWPPGSHAPGRPTTAQAPTAQAPIATDLANVVVVTEDLARLEDGCDALSVHDARTGRALDRGRTHVSPGRVAGRADLTLLAATHANGTGRPRDARPDAPFGPWLLLRWPGGSLAPEARDRVLAGLPVVSLGGLRFVQDGALLVALGSRTRSDGRTPLYLPAPPYEVARLALPDAGDADGAPRIVSRVRTPGLVGEIVGAADRGESHLVTLDGAVLTVDDETLMPRGAALPYPTAVAPPGARSQPPLAYFHASSTADDRYVLIGRMAAGDVAVADLAARRSALADLGADVDAIGGLDVNQGWENAGLVAVHAGDRVLVYAFAPPRTLTRRGELAIPPPAQARDPRQATGSGPALSLAWTGDGRHLVAAGDDGAAEFLVIEVSRGGRVLRHVRSLTACPAAENVPNGIWTPNGLLRPPPSDDPSR